jgi:mono/diheme cytochrome c family protein/uncharacterized membrane protein
MLLLTFTDLIGRFHPLLVHLPIGILLLAGAFQLLAIRSSYSFLQPVIPLMIFWGMISAVASCISGFMLASGGEYDDGLVSTHQWMGISTAGLSIVVYILYKKSVQVKTIRWAALALILMVGITGHLGGSLTHGTDYISAGLNGPVDKGPVLKQIPNVQQAVLYNAVVQPIFQARCYSCHGPSKQKGKLRLDQPDFITKGGEDGKVILPGNAGESDLMKRLLLPLEAKEHMPPKSKSQLTKDEITLLHWWVSSGTDFSKQISSMPQTSEIKKILADLESGTMAAAENALDIPENPVQAADTASIGRLHRLGIMIIPVSQNSNYLSANFVTALSASDSVFKLLAPLEKQLVWVKMDAVSINDAAMKQLVKCKSITRLQLSNTNISDSQLAELKHLPQLQSLNLVGTKITAAGLLQLQPLKKLRNIYFYRSGVKTSDWSSLQKAFPEVILDSGKYQLPMLASDTSEVKMPK